MEGLEVEGCVLATTRLLAQRQPQALADRVRRRLPRPAEVAVELEAQEALGHVGVRRQECPRLVVRPGAPTNLGGSVETAVHADVDDDARGAQRLPVEHAEAGGVVRVEAELVHEALGVQGPALRVPGRPRPHAAPPVEQARAVHRLPDLQVMAGDALVVDGRQFAPRAEPFDALRHRPPHASGAGEILARAGVVDAARGRGRDHALDATHRVGDVEVRVRQSADGGVSARLHPGAQRVGAVQGVRVVGVEGGHRALDAGAGRDAFGEARHLVGDAREFVLTPAVGLLEVDPCAEELAAVQRIPLTPHPVVLGRARQQFVAQPRPCVGVGPRGERGSLAHLVLHRAGIATTLDGGALSEREEVPVASAVLGALLAAAFDLALRRDDALRRGVIERREPAVERLGDGAQPVRDRLPVLVAVGRHEVEGVAHHLQRRRDDVEVGEVVAGVVDLLGELEALLQRGERHGVDVVLRRRGAQRRQRRATQIGRGRVAVGGEVVEQMILARDAERRCLDRRQRDGRVEVAVRDLVETGRGAGLARGAHVPIQRDARQSAQVH